MTRNGKKSEFEFFARNEVGICSDSYHSARNLLGSARICSECVGEGKLLREDSVIVMKMGRAATQRKKVPAPVQRGQRERRPEAAERGSKGKYRFIQPFPSRKNDEIFHLQTIENYIFYSTFL